MSVDFTQHTNEIVVTNASKDNVVSCVAFGALGIVTLIVSFILHAPLVVVMLAGLFAVVAIALIFSMHEQTTVLTKDGARIAVTGRLDPTVSDRTIGANDMKKVIYIFGFDEKSIGGRRGSQIILELVSGEKVTILERWAVDVLTFARRNPLTTEANAIAQLLGLPIDIVDIRTLKSGARNFSRAIKAERTQDDTSFQDSSSKTTKS